MKLTCSFALAAMIALLTTAAAHAQAVEEVYPIDVTIAQNQPLEIIRTLHSFDPCLACSTHVMSPDGQEMAKVTVR